METALDLGARLDLTSDPALAQAALERFWAVAPAGVRQVLAAERGLAQALVTLLAGSEYLGEALIQTPEWLLWLAQERDRPSRAPEEWMSALAAFTAGLPEAQRPRGLAQFKRREYLRIAVRDLQGHAGLAETTRELSDLADAILQQAFAWSWNELVGPYGTPRGERGSAEFVVISLGKLGGGELNYSSDIDLLFAYSEDGNTAGGGISASNLEFFTRLARSLIRYVSAVTAEGTAYRVDLRLRPGGREGELVQSLAQLQRYYTSQAREWELQMLVRARGSAGAPALAAQLLQPLSHCIFPAAPAAPALAAGVRAARQAISDQLEHHRALRRQPAGLNVKLDPGGIRDIEFLTQYWQRLHGGRVPWVRSAHTLLALQRLHDQHLIRSQEFQTLASAYILLRHLEHRLQLRLGQQTHSLPHSPQRLVALERSLRMLATGLPEAGGSLASAIAQRMAAVRALYRHYLDAGAAEGVAASAPPPASWLETVPLSPHGLRQGQRLARSLAADPDAAALSSALVPTVLPRLRLALEHSDWMADLLVRRPKLALAPAQAAPLPGIQSLAAGMTALRLWQQQRQFDLLAEEWEAAAPISATLGAHTRLAETILSAALDLARAYVALPEAAPKLAVLGLGRLGLGDLDLLSDVDLVFVTEPGARSAASTLASRFIQVLTAYTQAGTLYPVDVRLRPEGGEGELVQTPASLARYFEQRAGLWEAMSYAKGRRVAGDPELAQNALQLVRQQCQRRWTGQDFAAEARGLRARMEREGHPGRWGLKTVAGGSYDVDFIVSCRLLAAGLPGPGPSGLAGWVRSAAALLPEGAASELEGLILYLRAADHALRVATGKAGAAVPAAGAALDRAWAWLQRIAPQPPPAAAAAAGAAERIACVQARIRDLYHTLCQEGVSE